MHGLPSREPNSGLLACSEDRAYRTAALAAASLVPLGSFWLPYQLAPESPSRTWLAELVRDSLPILQVILYRLFLVVAICYVGNAVNCHEWLIAVASDVKHYCEA